MKVYTKLNGKLACWEIDTDDYIHAIWWIRNQVVGLKHNSALLVSIK